MQDQNFSHQTLTSSSLKSGKEEMKYNRHSLFFLLAKVLACYNACRMMDQEADEGQGKKERNASNNAQHEVHLLPYTSKQSHFYACTDINIYEESSYSFTCNKCNNTRL